MRRLVELLRQHWLWPALIVPTLIVVLMYAAAWRLLAQTFELIDKLAGGN